MNAPIICNKEQAEALATRDAISGVCRDAAFFGPNKGFWVTYQERHISLRRRIREKREAAQKDGVYKKIRRYRATIMAMHAELGTIAKVAEEFCPSALDSGRTSAPSGATSSGGESPDERTRKITNDDDEL